MLHAKQLDDRLPVFESGYLSAWWGAFSLYHLLAILLPIRRASGMLVQPLSDWELWIVVLFVVSIGSLFRISSVWLGVTTNASGQRWIACLPTIASLLIVGSVSASFRFLVLVAWGVLLASETAWLMRFHRTSRVRWWRSDGESAIQSAMSATLAAPVTLRELDGEFNGIASVEDESLPAGVTQQLVRSRHDHGESLSGLLRVDFPSGDRTQFVHVAFCPPFTHEPEVQVAQVSGPAVLVKTAQAESFGMRIEVRRNQTDCEPLSVVLEIEATASTDE